MVLRLRASPAGSVIDRTSWLLRKLKNFDAGHEEYDVIF